MGFRNSLLVYSFPFIFIINIAMGTWREHIGIFLLLFMTDASNNDSS
jgi:hypothetical protein